MSSEHILVDLGDPLPLELLLTDGNVGKFPQAIVRDVSTGATVVGSPFSLTHLGEGLYRNVAFTPTSVGKFRAVFIIYNESGHTTESIEYPRSTDNFLVIDKVLTIKTFLALK